MTAEPHPLRCATCNEKKCQIHDANKLNWKTKKDKQYRRAIRITISSVGCASHSSSDKVLDELKGIIKWGVVFGNDMIPGYIAARITHIERELQQQKERP